MALVPASVCQSAASRKPSRQGLLRNVQPWLQEESSGATAESLPPRTADSPGSILPKATATFLMCRDASLESVQLLVSETRWGVKKRQHAVEVRARYDSRMRSS